MDGDAGFAYSTQLDHDKIHDVYQRAAVVLDSLILRWFVYAGQALAITRQQKLVPHACDQDLDFCAVLERDDDGDATSKRIRAAFAEAGFTYHGGYESDGPDGRRKVHQLLFQAEMCLVDLVFYYPSRDRDLVFNLNEHGRKEFSAFLFATPARVEFDGRTWPLPNPPEAYLEHAFKGDWRVPATEKGNWSDECRALRGSTWEWI